MEPVEEQDPGDGKMTITAVRPPDYFEYRMEFADMGMAAKGTMELAAVPDGTTRVTMAMEGDLGRSRSTAGSGSSWAGLWPRTSTRGWRTLSGSARPPPTEGAPMSELKDLMLRDRA